MNSYWLGLATIPGLLVGGWLVAFLGIRLLGLLSMVSLGVAHRLRPAKSDRQRRALGAAGYSLERGFACAVGELCIIVGLGSDPEKREFAYKKLLRPFAAPAINPAFFEDPDPDGATSTDE